MNNSLLISDFVAFAVLFASTVLAARGFVSAFFETSLAGLMTLLYKKVIFWSKKDWPKDETLLLMNKQQWDAWALLKLRPAWLAKIVTCRGCFSWHAGNVLTAAVLFLGHSFSGVFETWQGFALALLSWPLAVVHFERSQRSSVEATQAALQKQKNAESILKRLMSQTPNDPALKFFLFDRPCPPNIKDCENLRQEYHEHLKQIGGDDCPQCKKNGLDLLFIERVRGAMQGVAQSETPASEPIIIKAADTVTKQLALFFRDDGGTKCDFPGCQEIHAEYKAKVSELRKVDANCDIRHLVNEYRERIKFILASHGTSDPSVPDKAS